MELKATIARLMNGDGKIRAFAAVTLTDGQDTFAIHDIKVIQGAKGPFVAMPSKMTAEGAYIDIAHPLSNDTRTRTVIICFTDMMLKKGFILSGALYR